VNLPDKWRASFEARHFLFVEKMKHRGLLAISIALSLCAHLVFIFSFTVDSAPAVVLKKLKVSFAPTKKPIVGRPARTTVPSPMPAPPSSDNVLVSPSVEIEAHPTNRIVFGSDALDNPLQLTNDLELDPEEKYPADLTGRAELNLLIANDGSVRWVAVEQSDLTDAVLKPLIEKFQNAKFSPPVVGGLPTWVLIRVEINVGSGGL